MTKARLLQAVCAVSLLAAAPAFAQTDTQGASTGANNNVNMPAASDGTPSQSNRMAPASNMGASNESGSSGSMSSHSMHHRAGAMHARNDTSQDAAVDQLNDQSYQAAQRGQAFSASNMNAGNGSMAPNEPGSMSGSGSQRGTGRHMNGGSPPGSDAVPLQDTGPK